jgi:hypothetical protein
VLLPAGVCILSAPESLMLLTSNAEIPHGLVELPQNYKVTQIYRTSYRQGFCLVYLLTVHDRLQIMYSNNFSKRFELGDFQPLPKYKYLLAESASA